MCPRDEGVNSGGGRSDRRYGLPTPAAPAGTPAAPESKGERPHCHWTPESAYEIACTSGLQCGAMMGERAGSKTDANLLVALAGEADANRRYLAYGIRALNEGRADIAQLFFEAAGAETIHALNHLTTMGAVGTTRQNLEHAATGEMEEIEVILPRMIREADDEGRADAAESFRLALDRERHHRDMFRTALKDFDRAGVARGAAAVIPTPDTPASGIRASRPAHPPSETVSGVRASRGGVGGVASSPPTSTI